MRGVFICYRRDDSEGISGRLYDRLVSKLGRQRVFKDVFSIDLGHDFDEVIGKALQKTDVLLVVMGNQWNVARLKAADDPVRKELERALALGIRIVPLFVRGMKMPDRNELPESLHAFARCNGMPLREDPDFDNDVHRLLRSIAPSNRCLWMPLP